MRYRASLVGKTAVALAALSAATAAAATTQFGAWGPAVRVESLPGTDPSFNGASLDGCPTTSRDGKLFFMASNRPGGLGGIDIWVASRASADDGWGPPVNVGAPVNSPDNDFCPVLAADGHTFYFVSNRPGGHGGTDVYVTRLRPRGWDPPENVCCGVNSSADEAGPVPLTEPAHGPVLYFSSNRAGGFSAEAAGAVTGDSDLYVSEVRGRTYGLAALVPGANGAAEDGQPFVRRDGLELLFFSTRPGGLGMADIWSATRARTWDAWSEPVNLGPNVNSADGAETRPSLSADGTELYFGSTRPGGEGSSDHYVATRER